MSTTRSRLVAVAVALGLVLAGCSGGDDAAPDADPTTTTAPPETTAPAGKPPGATEIGLRDVETGQCVDPIDDPLVDDLAVWVVSCESPHTFEVYDVITYEGEGAGPGTDFPGVATVQDWAEQACFDRFEAFVGIRWTTSELDINVWWPSEESWARADRTVICAVMSDTGDQLTGTARGSGI